MPIGKLEPFDLNAKQWHPYIRRVKQYILLNELKDDLHVPLLITVVGEATYALMCDLCSPTHPESKSFDDLVKLVAEHLEPQRSEIAERHVFRLRRQKVGESLTEYLQNLKHLATTCNFGATLEENLRDQFVSGLASETMRSRIFAEKSIKYKEAVELSLALEAAERHAEVSGATGTSAAGITASGGDEGLHLTTDSARRRGGGVTGGSGPPRSQRGGAPAPARCWRCGKGHRPDRCRFAKYNCDECNKRGHLKVMCSELRGSGGGRSYGHNYVSERESSEDEDFYNIGLVAEGNKPYIILVKIDDQLVKCEIDTGSRISAVSEQFYKNNFSNKTLKPDNLLLRCYSGSRIESIGYIDVDVELGDVKVSKLSLYIIKNGGRPLLGREWIRALNIKQISFNEILEDNFVSRLTVEFPEVFTDKLGTCKQKLVLRLSDEEPVYVRARPVPLALRARVARELERLEAAGTIYRVEHSQYGTPIVPVVKESGDIRICGDYKITINPKLIRDFYPLPRIEELFAALSGGEEYSKIDLTHAYEQCLLSEESQPCTAITTHLGTFVYRRTPYGLSCIPEKFQRLMEETLRGVPGCVVFLDDICCTGSSRSAHLSNLRAVLTKLRDMGFTIKLNKCSFLKSNVKYLGFIIDKLGLHPDPMKVKAISDAPRPENVTQLKSFLGLLNYYGKFIPNLSILLEPLHSLLKKDIKWSWTAECEKAFIDSKHALLSERVLAHYSEGCPLVLSVDSSAYGLGAILAHRLPDGTEKPVSCVSRTLNSAERNYSQLDKEALAIFFGITRHHQYLFGRHFCLRTDHKPLTYILGKKGGIPQTAASRLQRWAARLAAYDFSVEFVRSEDNGPANALSRLPLSTKRPLSDPVSYLNLVQEYVPVNYKEVAKETKKDILLSKIVGYVMFGWPSVAGCDEEKAYHCRKREILLDLGCLIYKYRIIIPPTLQKRVLDEIHDGHLGIVKMKNLARNYVYWPTLDHDIESVGKICEPCRAVRDAPPHAVLHPWEFPSMPWQRLHADFAECAGKKYLIVIDAHSKWIETITMLRTDAPATINALRSIFARFGLPSQLVTDNGPPFFSSEFKDYCSNNCIRHVTSAPYRPQGNGAAENAVKIIKKAIKRALIEGENVPKALSVFLFQYRNCEQATTGVSPAMALLGRRLRGRLDALRPDVARAVEQAQRRQVASAGGTHRDLKIGDTVLARDYSARGEKWSPGEVVRQTGPVSFRVNVGNGVDWKRHQDQLIPLKKVNRYSLTRTNETPAPVPTEDENVPDRDVSDADDTFEDAAGEGEEKEGLRSPQSESRSGPMTRPVGSDPAPGASARELRAYYRSKKRL